MLENEELKTVVLWASTLKLLDALKVHERQPYREVIDQLVKEKANSGNK